MCVKLGCCVCFYHVSVFSSETRAAVRDIACNIQQPFESQIKNSNWLVCETRQVALRKLFKIKVIISFPQTIHNEAAVDEYWYTCVPLRR